MPRRVTLDEDDDDNDNEHDALRRSTFSNRRTHPSAKNGILKTPATPIPVQSPPFSPPPPKLNWEHEYRVLRKAHLRQERRLQALEKENEALRQQVNYLRNNNSSDETTTVPTPTTNTTTQCAGSPGTKFVAELVEVMELDVGQHVLLSEIIDRRQDEQQRRKSNSEASLL